MSALPSPLEEERFQPPPGWRFGNFNNPQNVRIRFGYGAPEFPRALVCILPGRAEYIEKYFEIARDLLAQGYAVCAMDWAGQGGSGRCDAPDFALLAEDMNILLNDHLPGNLKALPKIMLAHSMGANIGLRYLHGHPGVFKGAVMTAPLLGIPAARMPLWLAVPVSGLLTCLTKNNYAFGQKDWDPHERLSSNIFSSDPVRRKVHDAWYEANDSLKIGGVTFGWIYQALKSCAIILNPKFLLAVQTPCLIALAGHEKLVDNEAARMAADILPHADLVEYKAAAHEVLMEKDAVRGDFLARFYNFVKKFAET